MLNHSSADNESATPRTVLRGVYLPNLLHLGLDSLYLVIEYPSDDVFQMWRKGILCELDDPDLHAGVPYGSFLIRRGLLSYKLSVWEGDARLLMTDRVADNSPSGRGMGLMLQLGPKWLTRYGDPVAEKTFRQNIYEQLRSFGVKNPEQYPARMNRLDIALDFLGCKVNDFSIDDWWHNWVGRTKLRGVFFEKRSGVLEGLAIGSKAGAIRLEIYDKVLQAKKDKDFDFWRSVWGVEGDEPFEVARFEWSFRPYNAHFKGMRYLDEFTYFDFLELLNYASQKWGRLCVPQEDDSNRSRWVSAPLWEELRAWIEDWSFNYKGMASREYHLAPDLNQDYMRNLAGHVAGLQARVAVKQGRRGPVSTLEALQYLEEQGGYGAEALYVKATNKHEKLSRLAGVEYPPEEDFDD
ncbi:MAG: hypothetical protein JXN59_05840 [Anaerolineae bacterium]|nr:hypothetical protein [Anaerolineae bacterium]